MKPLIILMILSLFAFNQNAYSYSAVPTIPPAEKNIKKQKIKKKKLFKKRLKRQKTQQKTKIKTSTICAIVFSFFGMHTLISTSIISVLIGWGTMSIIILLTTLALALTFLIIGFIYLDKEKKNKTE